MSSTNKTSNLELSQFIGTDSPKWLTDYNSDMQKIDAGVTAVQTQADATDLVVAGHTSTIQSNSQSISDQQTAITSLRSDVTAAQGSINTINSLIGNGEPTTTDKTIIGAINEIAEDVDILDGAKNKFVFYPTFLQVSVAGLTTFSDLANAIITAINNHLATLGDHQGVRLKSLRFTGLEEVYTQTSYRYSHGDTFYNANFSAIVCDTGAMKLSSLHLDTLPKYQHVNIASDGTVTYSGLAAETIASLGITNVYIMFDRITELV